MVYLKKLYLRYGGVVSGYFCNDFWRLRDEYLRDIFDKRLLFRELLINDKKVMRGYGLCYIISI